MVRTDATYTEGDARLLESAPPQPSTSTGPPCPGGAPPVRSYYFAAAQFIVIRPTGTNVLVRAYQPTACFDHQLDEEVGDRPCSS